MRERDSEELSCLGGVRQRCQPGMLVPVFVFRWPVDGGGVPIFWTDLPTGMSYGSNCSQAAFIPDKTAWKRGCPSNFRKTVLCLEM
jgi:hypothetical protein